MAQKEEVPPPMDSVAVSRRYLLRVIDLPESEDMVNQVLSFVGQINSFRVDVMRNLLVLRRFVLRILALM